jgi:guanylate kinase
MMMNRAITRRGLILVLSSPSGAGKTTLTRRLLEVEAELEMSISVTTRPRRPNEVDGEHYHFIDRLQFDEMVARGELLEHATVFGNCYGTPRALVDTTLSAGRDVVSDLDWQGTQQLAQTCREDMVSVFILPPSVAELERRLTQRNQDSAQVVAQRMAKAVDEMSHWAEYDYVLVNEDLARSVAVLQAILTAERAKRVRQIGLFEFVRDLTRRE